jgi:hypothetical protein
MMAENDLHCRNICWSMKQQRVICSSKTSHEKVLQVIFDSTLCGLAISAPNLVGGRKKQSNNQQFSQD